MQFSNANLRVKNTPNANSNCYTLILLGDDHSECNVTSIWESDMSTNRCPHEDWTVPFIAGVFVLFSNLLLVNLVIAMFR